MLKITEFSFQQRKRFSLKDVGILIQELLGDTFQPMYMTQEKYALLDADYIIDGVQPRRVVANSMKLIATQMMDPANNFRVDGCKT